MATKPLRVVLCWHMHQPDYRDPSNVESLTPWPLKSAMVAGTPRPGAPCAGEQNE